MWGCLNIEATWKEAQTLGRGGLYGRPQPGPASRLGTMAPPATGFPVGAHCICALTAPPEPGGLRKSQACSDGYKSRPYGPRLRSSRRGRCPHAAMTRCMDRRSSIYRTRLRTRDARPYDGCVRRWCIRHGGTGGHTGRPYGPASGFLVGTGPFTFHNPPAGGAKCTAPEPELCILTGALIWRTRRPWSRG